MYDVNFVSPLISIVTLLYGIIKSSSLCFDGGVSPVTWKDVLVDFVPIFIPSGYARICGAVLLFIFLEWFAMIPLVVYFIGVFT